MASTANEPLFVVSRSISPDGSLPPRTKKKVDRKNQSVEKKRRVVGSFSVELYVKRKTALIKAATKKV